MNTEVDILPWLEKLQNHLMVHKANQRRQDIHIRYSYQIHSSTDLKGVDIDMSETQREMRSNVSKIIFDITKNILYSHTSFTVLTLVWLTNSIF